MADINGRRVLELVRKPGNSFCADCSCAGVDYASYNIGVFLCTQCAGIHRNLGTNISKVKHLKLDRWEDSQVKRLEEVGNLVARRKYEERVPMCYRRPNENDPQILREQWIKAKYEREEFILVEKQRYLRGAMEGFLYKRSKVDDSCKQRRFVLSEKDQTLKYYVNNNKLKGEMRILELNVAFVPDKFKSPNWLQFTYIDQGSTRHIYVRHDEAEVVVEWYTAIRSSKLNLLQVAYPTAPEAELAQMLTHDFTKESYLLKTGPRPSDGFKKRWFTLDGRKLMYHDQKLDAHPKGEIFIGHSSDGYGVEPTVPPGWKVRDQGFSFHVKTPNRAFLMSADRPDERDEWIAAIQSVINKPMTPQDSFCRSTLNPKACKKRNSFF